MIGRTVAAAERFAALIVLAAATALAAGCGGDVRPAAREAPPAEVTPVPPRAPAPTPTAQIHEGDETPTPEATATATATAQEEGGDESGTRVPVGLTIAAGRIRADDDVVPAFLPLRLVVANDLDREVQVVVTGAGEGGGAIARATVAADGSAVVDLPGLRPGVVEVLSPDLGPGATLRLRVEPGAG